MNTDAPYISSFVTPSARSNSFEKTMAEYADHDWSPGSQSAGTSLEARARAFPKDDHGQATPIMNIDDDTPPATDDEFNNYDLANFIPQRASDESSVHDPAHATSTGTQNSRVRNLSTGSIAVTALRAEAPSSTSARRDAYPKPSRPAPSEVAMAPGASRRKRGNISRLEVIAQTALQSPTEYSRADGEEVIDPALRTHATAASPVLRQTHQAESNHREFIHNSFSHDNQIWTRQSMTRLSENQIDSAQSSILLQHQSCRPEASMHNREEGMGNQTSRPDKCILEDYFATSDLLKRLEGLVAIHPKGLHEGVLHTRLVDDVIKPFYDKYACGPADSPSDVSLLVSIEKFAPVSFTAVVKEIDKIYFQAGWRLKRQQPKVASSILQDANSTSAQSRSKTRSAQHQPPPTKRRQKSPTGTTLSWKRSKGDSTQQSFASAVTDSHTSVSRIIATKVYPCCLCKKVSQSIRKWKTHYDSHFPLCFRACDACGIIASRPDSMSQHCDSEKHGRNVLGLEPSQDPFKHKYIIRDGGHECCIYCTQHFNGWESRKKRDHIVDHVKIGDAEYLKSLFNHRCKDPKCGKRNHWKNSKYTLLENRQRIDDTIIISEDDESEGDDESERDNDIDWGDRNHRNSGNEWNEQNEHESNEFMPRDQRALGGKGGRNRGGRGGRRGGRSGARERLTRVPLPGNRVNSTEGQGIEDTGPGSHVSLQSLRRSQEQDISPVHEYLGDGEGYAVVDGRIPSRRSPPAAVESMGQHINDIARRVNNTELMTERIPGVDHIP